MHCLSQTLWREVDGMKNKLWHNIPVLAIDGGVGRFSSKMGMTSLQLYLFMSGLDRKEQANKQLFYLKQLHGTRLSENIILHMACDMRYCSNQPGEMKNIKLPNEYFYRSVPPHSCFLLLLMIETLQSSVTYQMHAGLNPTRSIYLTICQMA